MPLCNRTKWRMLSQWSNPCPDDPTTDSRLDFTFAFDPEVIKIVLALLQLYGGMTRTIVTRRSPDMTPRKYSPPVDEAGEPY